MYKLRLQKSFLARARAKPSYPGEELGSEALPNCDPALPWEVLLCQEQAKHSSQLFCHLVMKLPSCFSLSSTPRSILRSAPESLIGGSQTNMSQQKAHIFLQLGLKSWDSSFHPWAQLSGKPSPTTRGMALKEEILVSLVIFQQPKH